MTQGTWDRKSGNDASQPKPRTPLGRSEQDGICEHLTAQLVNHTPRTSFSSQGWCGSSPRGSNRIKDLAFARHPGET